VNRCVQDQPLLTFHNVADERELHRPAQEPGGIPRHIIVTSVIGLGKHPSAVRAGTADDICTQQWKSDELHMCIVKQQFVCYTLLK
jgi:hypothetical protein